MNYAPHTLIVTLCAATSLLAEQLDLGGAWQIAPMAGSNWFAGSEPTATTGWVDTMLPGPAWLPGVERHAGQERSAVQELQAAPGVWARRTFVLTRAQAGRDAVLRWELIRWGFAARVNGALIGATDVYSPGTFAIPRGLLREGTNDLLLAVRGWSSVPRGGPGGDPLMPVGAGLFSWGSKNSGVCAPVHIEFHDGVRIRSVIARPDVEHMRCTFVVRLEPADSESRSIDLSLKVFDPDGQPAAQTSVLAQCAGPDVVMIDAPIPGAKLWTPETPRLYSARAAIAGDGASDERDIAFGMRTFGSRDGHFVLNGARRRLRGSNILQEWNWGEDNFHNRDGCMSRYLGETARRMHANTFRTHTGPPAEWIATLCDSNGTMLIAEMPLTYNGHDMRFSAADEAAYRSNAVAMCAAWVEALANHPSIIMWVSSNEPLMGDEHNQYAWDFGTLIPAMKNIDPTRLIMRAGEESPDVQDTHCYLGYWYGAAGEFEAFARWRASTRDPRRPVMNSEYIEGAPPLRRYLWTGSESGTREWNMIYAMVGMEQTEALRRLGYDGILPYQFVGWQRGSWRADAPTPMFAALRSSLAPVAVSLDLADRNFAAGSTVNVPVHVMNDLNEPAAALLSCHVCASDPAFALDEEAYTNAAHVAALTIAVAAHGSVVTTVAFPLPQVEGECWLAVVLRPERGGVVMSQRPLRVLDASRAMGALSGITARVVGADAATIGALRGLGLAVRESLEFRPIEPEVDMVILWGNGFLGSPEASQSKWLNKYLNDGGAVLVLEREVMRQPVQNWQYFPTAPGGERIEYQSIPHQCSSVFPSPLNEVRTLWQGLENAHLVRWNGHLNAVCASGLDADWLDSAPPVRQTARGPEPAADAILIEGEAAVASTFKIDYPDAMFTEADERGGLMAKGFAALSGGRAALLCTRTTPDAAYEASYQFTADGAKKPHVFWVFEQARTWASPFEWRIDGGEWHAVTQDEPYVAGVRVVPGGPTFGWTRLGVVSLEPGRHTLDVRVTSPRTQGIYLLSPDCFLFAPLKGQTLAHSGNKVPLLARLSVGKGTLYVSRLLFADRLDRASKSYDPVVERLFVNMVKTARSGESAE
ncbi:hypothetical protein GX586_02100 [bacterium]|nr:hypothetical protein [bacterium]